VSRSRSTSTLFPYTTLFRSDLGAERIERYPAQVLAGDADFAGVGDEEARDEVNEGVLFHVVGPDEGDALAGLDAQVHAVQQRAAGARLLQGHVVELEMLGQRGQELGVHGLADGA